MPRSTKGVVEHSAPNRKRPTKWGSIRPWQYKRRGANLCSHCPRKRDGEGRYCSRCKSAYMRLYRIRKGA